MFCSNCGKEIENNENFCKNCGSSVNEVKKEEESVEDINEIKKPDIQEQKAVENINEIVVEEETIEKVIEEESIIDDKIESDKLDTWLNIKGKFTKEELSEKRFKSSYVVLYVFAVFNILVGGFLSYNSSNDLLSGITNNEILIGGVIYLVFTALFHTLKMPIMLGVLASGMFADKIFTMIITQKISALAIIVSVILFTAIIQSFRSRSHLQTTNKKVLKIIVSIFLFIVMILSAIGLFAPNIFEDTEWNNSRSLMFTNAIEKSYLDIGKEKPNIDKEFLKKVSKKTAECSMKNIKKEFPNYIEFLDGLKSETENFVQKRLGKIKSNCFGESIELLKKN